MVSPAALAQDEKGPEADKPVDPAIVERQKRLELDERREKLPVYLLDDIFGELEPSRRNALMAYLPERAQRWITTTHLDWLDDANPAGGMQRVEVVKGAVRM